MRDLIDRPVTFNYGYNISCADCLGVTSLSADIYHNEPDEAHVLCAHCGNRIHFGRAVLAPRNPSDPSLNDRKVRSFAWYHTSSIPDWPKDAHPMPPAEQEFMADKMTAEGMVAVRNIRENQALHLGTYEAAIESMLRRMRDLDDGGTPFFLHRVGLRTGDLTIEPGWRDENTEEVSQITQHALGQSHVVRYLNVRESPGSISLALRPNALQAVQTVSLPVPAVELASASRSLPQIARIRSLIDQIEAARPEGDLDETDRFRQKMAQRRGVPFLKSPTPEQYDLLEQIANLIADEYLSGVSLPVRDDFIRSLDAWHLAQETLEDDVAYVSRFASMARLLTQPEEVIQSLRDQPARDV
jgi:hypothetical protein